MGGVSGTPAGRTEPGRSLPWAVTASAPAKINLHLGVGRARADGFHPLATVYQAVDLRDEVTVRPAPAYALEVSGDDRLALADVPRDESNIALRAARLLAVHAGGVEGRTVAVHLHKRIPVAGGMAGGSADAAATLLACDALWGLETPAEELLALAAQLGSDVPFALLGETALGTGRGELVAPVMTRGDYWWVVVQSARGLSTPAVYREFDTWAEQVGELGEAAGLTDTPALPDLLLAALRHHDLPAVAGALHNDLELPATRLRPDLAEVLLAGVPAGALAALLSGSGPSCLFLCDGAGHAGAVATAFTAAGHHAVDVVHGPVPGARVERREVDPRPSDPDETKA